MQYDTELRLNGRQRQRLQEALISAFPTRGELARMINYKLDENLEVIAGGETYADVVFNLIQWAIARGRLEELVKQACEDNPGNPELRAFEEQVLRSSPIEPAQGEAVGELGDRIIVPPPGALNGPERYAFTDVGLVGNWCRRMWQVAQAVCLVQLHSHMATGFLIGPNLMLTCYHVMADLIEQSYYEDPITGNRVALLPERVRLRFGYMLTEGITEPAGQMYHLANDWLIDSSPVGLLNYALLRINGTPGTDWVGTGGEAQLRNWLYPAVEYEFQREAPLYILQHPAGRPIQVSYGTEATMDDQRTRVTYLTLTAPGSSGAPCFSARWELVAMHEQTEAAYPFARKGIPISAIIAQPKVQAALGGH